MPSHLLFQKMVSDLFEQQKATYLHIVDCYLYYTELVPEEVGHAYTELCVTYG